MSFLLNPYIFGSGGISSPDEVSDLVAWWDPDDATTVTLSSGDVVQLNDKVGSVNLEDANSNPPQQVTVGGREWMRFDASNSEAMFNNSEYAASGINFGSGDFSLFLVFSTSSSTSNMRPLNKGTNSNGRYAMDINRPTTGDGRAFTHDGTIGREVNGDPGSGINDGNPHVFNMVRDNSNTDLILYIDGTEIGTVSISTLGDIDDTTSSGFFRQLIVGAAPATSTTLTSFFDGDIGEILFYDRTLTTTQRNQVTTYLSNKWGA